MAKIADARKTVEQLKLEVNIERMMVGEDGRRRRDRRQTPDLSHLLGRYILRFPPGVKGRCGSDGLLRESRQGGPSGDPGAFLREPI